MIACQLQENTCAVPKFAIDIKHTKPTKLFNIKICKCILIISSQLNQFEKN